MSRNLTTDTRDTRVSDKRNSVVSRRFEYSGPIPPPALLNQYDAYTRKIIIAMAHRQSLHRQSIESSVITANIWSEKAGMLIAGFLTVLMLFAGVYLLMNDKDAIGFLLIFGPAVFHAGNYLYNKKQEDQLKQQEDEAEASVQSTTNTTDDFAKKRKKRR